MDAAAAAGASGLWGDQRAAVIQGLTHQSELAGLLGFLRAACQDPLQTEAWVSFEMVYTTTVDRRQRAVVLQREFVEAVASATETADLSRFSFDAREAARRSPRVEARQALVYEERDVRSSTEALVRRRVITPIPGWLEGWDEQEQQGEGEGQGDEESAAMGQFLEFQGCSKRAALARRGVRCQLHEGVRVSIFTVQKPPGEVDRPGVPPAATCPFPEKGGEDVLVEIEAPIREGGGGGLLKSIEAAREAAATLQDFIVLRKPK